MRLDTPIGHFTAHFDHQRFYTRTSLHRGPCPKPAEGKPRVECAADSKVTAKLSLPARFQRDFEKESRAAAFAAGARALGLTIEIPRPPDARPTMRARGLAKCMRRLGLSREERTHLWQAYFSQVAVLPRTPIAWVTTCEAGHKMLVACDSVPNLRLGPPITCYFKTGGEPAGLGLCGRPTLPIKNRALYTVELPKGRRQRKIEAAQARQDDQTFF